ncbi:MAG: 4Fe-4S binding protein [Syntrophomonadaceae bacterium]|nr:4Fe-4S binding protein [Syntrophomonadaceae bacterium]
MAHPVVDENLCVGEGDCENVCPTDPNVFKVDEIAHVVNPDACIECELCVDNCPEEAIKMTDD